MNRRGVIGICNSLKFIQKRYDLMELHAWRGTIEIRIWIVNNAKNHNNTMKQPILDRWVSYGKFTIHLIGKFRLGVGVWIQQIFNDDFQIYYRSKVISRFEFKTISLSFLEGIHFVIRKCQNSHCTLRPSSFRYLKTWNSFRKCTRKSS